MKNKKIIGTVSFEEAMEQFKNSIKIKPLTDISIDDGTAARIPNNKEIIDKLNEVIKAVNLLIEREF